MKSDYSKKEEQLFKTISSQYYDIRNDVSPPQLYRMMVEHSFNNNLQGPAIESLRRCSKALTDCSIYRNTKEWDDLIKL